ncbi:hypothetical protein K3495_g8654 [Podosphaera aphanis]|nr:hypothetical protein K3495_g8654 [Podosphaera aphanis]
MTVWNKLTQSNSFLEQLHLPMRNFGNTERFNYGCLKLYLYNTASLAIERTIEHLNENPTLRANLGLEEIVTYRSLSETLVPETYSDENVPLSYPPYYTLCIAEPPRVGGKYVFNAGPRILILEHRSFNDLKYEEFKDVFRSMDLNSLDYDTESSDNDERLRSMFAAHISEVYCRIIEEELEFRCVCSGGLTIFPRVAENEGHNVYFHVSTPLEDMKDLNQSTGELRELNTGD